MTVSIQHARDILQQAELLYSAEQVQAALHKVAQEINAALADEHPLVLSVMGGAVVFTGQLLPLLDFPLDFDYVHVSRYGDAASRAGRCTGRSSRARTCAAAWCWWWMIFSTKARPWRAIKQRVMDLGASRVLQRGVRRQA